MLLVQTPAVQSALASRFVSRISDRINGDLTVERVQFLPFNTFILHNATLIDNAPTDSLCFTCRDTVAHVRMLTVSFSLKNLIDKEFRSINRVTIRGGELNFVIEGKRKNNLKKIFNFDRQIQTEADFSNIITIHSADIRDFTFRMMNYRAEYREEYPGIVNWYDLEATANIKCHEFAVKNGLISGTADHIDFIERSGCKVNELTGSVLWKKGTVAISDMYFQDDWSDIHLPHYSMNFNDRRAFRNFLDEVSIDAGIEESHLDFRSLKQFSKMNCPGLDISIHEAEVSGPVNRMNISRLSFSEADGTRAKVKCNLVNVTDIKRFSVNADIYSLGFTTRSLSSFINKLSPNPFVKIGGIAEGTWFNMSGHGSGPVNDMVFDGRIDSDSGSISGSFSVKDLVSTANPMTAIGRIDADHVDLGHFLKTDIVHDCCLRTAFNASISESNTSLTVDSLQISKLNVLGYNYSGIAGAGRFSDNSFNGRIVCSDPNINFIFQGIFNLSNKTNNALYKFYFNLGYSDLNAINLDKRGRSKASLALNANFMRITRGDLIGSIDMRDLELENIEGTHHIGNLSINSYSNEQTHRIRFRSSFAEGNYSGSKPMTNLLPALREATTMRELPTIESVHESVHEGEEYKLNFKFHDTRDLLSFVMPGLYVASGTGFNLYIDSDGRVSSHLKSQRIAIKDKYLKDIDAAAVSAKEQLRCKVSASELSAASYKLQNDSLEIIADNDIIKLGYCFDNKTYPETNGRLNLTGTLSRLDNGQIQTSVITDSSCFNANGNRWELSPSQFSYTEKGVCIDRLMVSNGEQRISVHGAHSRTESDTLYVDVNRMDIKPLLVLLGKNKDINGQATGHASIFSSPENRVGMLADIICDSTKICGYDAGRVTLSTNWEENSDDMAFSIKNEMFQKNPFVANGKISPSRHSISAKIKMDQMQIGYASGLVRNIFSEMEGQASGDISIIGPMSKPSIFSKDARIDNSRIRIAYTNVPYFVTGPFHITDNGIFFDDMELKDRLSGTGTVSGGISFDHLRNLKMDASIQCNGVEAVNTDEHDGMIPIYGTMYANGDVRLSGPFSAITMDADITTNGRGHLHIPLKNGNTSAGTGILTFKKATNEEWVDPYELMMKKLSELDRKKNTFGIRMHVNVRPEVECSLELDKQAGNILSGYGYGGIDLSIGKDGFEINGDYNLNSGKFHYNALGIASRDFSIQSGSSVKFNGDVMDSDLDIEARYSTKASLGALIADTTSVTSRRDVHCDISITDKIKNPKLGFSVIVPDLDPTTKSMVDGALNTEDKIQKQFLALLVARAFIPDEQSGVFNNSEILFSNVSTIMSEQLNNIFEKLQIPVDLGLKYQPNEGGTDIFDVAVSTQLFNNRVLVNGNIGNRQYSHTSTQQDVAGDLDIEFKVDKAGSVKLSMFSHSPDQYSNYLDYTQRNGIGIGYQKEFDSLKEFFRNLFSGKKNRNGASGVKQNYRYNTIQIEKDE